MAPASFRPHLPVTQLPSLNGSDFLYRRGLAPPRTGTCPAYRKVRADLQSSPLETIRGSVILIQPTIRAHPTPVVRCLSHKNSRWNSANPPAPQPTLCAQGCYESMLLLRLHATEAATGGGEKAYQRLARASYCPNTSVLAAASQPAPAIAVPTEQLSLRADPLRSAVRNRTGSQVDESVFIVRIDGVHDTPVFQYANSAYRKIVHLPDSALFDHRCQNRHSVWQAKLHRC